MNEALLLKNATVIDPARGIKEKSDVLVKDGVITKVASGIPPEENWQVEDLSGKYLSPGWVDMHAHVTGDLAMTGVEPDDAGIKTGVTTVVDAGSSGAAGLKGFKRYVIDPAKTSVVVFMNAGVSTGSILRGTYTDLRNMNLELSLKALEAFPGLVKGIKVMASVTQVGNNGIEPVKIAKKLARLAGLPLMVHIGNAPPVIDDVLDLLDEGDIVTHAFHGKPGGILGRDDKPIPRAIEAKTRGVWFDVGHGSESFSFACFKKAVDAGLEPDSISTDLHGGNINGPVFDMGTTLAKFLALGYSLEQVIDLVTRRPAQKLGLRVGTLDEGSPADITVFQVLDQEAVLMDSERAKLTVSRVIKPVLTIKNGTKVWSA